MNELFIKCNNYPLLAELTTDYLSVEATLDKVKAAESDLKIKRGQRVKQDHPKYLERERAYEVSFIKLRLESDCLFAEIRKLHATRSKVRAALSAERSDWCLTDGALVKNNIMCADELCEEASKLYYAVGRLGDELDRMASYCFAIEKLFNTPVPADGPREFVVMSSGHGSAFRFCGGDGTQVPPAPYMTLAEAIADAVHWERISDTIGGRAQIYNVRTAELTTSSNQFRPLS